MTSATVEAPVLAPVNGWRVCESPRCALDHGQFYSAAPARLCPACLSKEEMERKAMDAALRQEGRDAQIGDELREEHERTCIRCCNGTSGPTWARRLRCQDYPR